MKVLKKLIILSIVINCGALASISKIDGGISKNNFYDMDKTIMTEIPMNKTIKTEKYWEKNLLYFNKYRPIFMLSNKELYDLMPKENVSVVQRISTPSVYNISLKTASIKTISLAPATLATKTAIQKKQPAQKTEPKTIFNTLYEQAKNPDVEPEKKIDIAIALKDSRKQSNYALAIDLLNDVTKKEPYNAYAFYLKGELYSEKKDSEKAMKNYIEALKINPTSKQCCLGIARILEPTNKELAQKYYSKAK